MWFYILIGLLFTFKKMKHIIPIGLVFLGLLAISYLFPDAGYSIVFKKVSGFVPFINYIPLFLAGIVFYKIINSKENRFWYYIILVLCFAVKIIPSDNGAFIQHTEYLWMLILYFSLFILFVNHKLNFLVSKPTLFLGKISFALYLIHQFISTEVVLPFLINQCQINYWIAALITLAIVAVIATGVTYLIEIPLGKRMNTSLRTALHLQKRK
jgi:peptidoglycan/LPS O-acetylase OafA/YrhL